MLLFHQKARACFMTSLLLAASAAAACSSQAPAVHQEINCAIQRGPCKQAAAEGTIVVFDILPKPVKPLTNLDFIITITRESMPLKPASVSLDLTMPGMYMGQNRPVLRQVQPGRYEAKGVITRCSSNKKIWQAEITLEHNAKTSVVAFVFEVS